MVDVVAHINNNWDDIEAKLSNLTLLPSLLPSPETGQELAFSSAQTRFRVWTGAAYRDPDPIDPSWSAWTALPLSANVVARTGTTPRFRTNSLIRQVQLTGAIQKDAPG